jgi:hypothetical protein
MSRSLDDWREAPRLVENMTKWKFDLAEHSCITIEETSEQLIGGLL